MNTLATLLEMIGRGFKYLVRDLAPLCVGLYLAVQLGRGAIQNPALIPVVGGLATSLIFGPVWLYQDRQNRNGNKPPRKAKRLKITFGEDDPNDDESDESPRR